MCYFVSSLIKANHYRFWKKKHSVFICLKDVSDSVLRSISFFVLNCIKAIQCCVLKSVFIFSFMEECKATSTSVREREMNAKTHAKHIMWTYRRTAFGFIRLCSICSTNRRTLSVWSRYFKEKYVHHRTDVDVHSFSQPTNNQRKACSFACAANTEQATFWHLPPSRMPCLRSCTDVDAS